MKRLGYIKFVFACIFTLGIMLLLYGCSHQHLYEETVLRTANCVEDGLIEYRCSKCGESFTESVSGNHEYEEKVLEDSTCQKEGNSQFTCMICGDSYYAVVPLKPHDYADKVCVSCGERKIGKIKLPRTPAELDYGAAGVVRTTCKITGVSYDISYGLMTIYINGKMIYNASGEKISGPCSFMLIIYDKYGEIIYSEQVMTHCIVNQAFNIYTSPMYVFDESEDYRIELSDYMM